MEFVIEPPCIAVIYHSVGGRIEELTRDFAKGLEAIGEVNVVLLAVPDTVPLRDSVPLVLGEGPEKCTPVPGLESTTIGELTMSNLATLGSYDGIAFGITARFGMMSAQMKHVFDSMSGLWAVQALHGVPATCFVATGTQAGGQESTVLSAISCLAHHGMMYVPTGYSFERMRVNIELQGGTPFGAGTFAGDGTRTPSEYEKSYATHHGQLFAETVRSLKLGGATRTKSWQRDV